MLSRLRPPFRLAAHRRGAVLSLPTLRRAAHPLAPPPSSPPFDLISRAGELRVRLSPRELNCLREFCDVEGKGDGSVTREEFAQLVRAERDDRAERETLVNFIVKSDAQSIDQWMLKMIDYAATALFGAVGTILAGQTGMNVVGATFVGCVACLGGGTLNDIMTGNTRQGVFWMRNPTFLVIALATSLLTFYAWPMYEQLRAQQQMNALRQAAGVAPGGGIGYNAFVAALDKDPKEAKNIFHALDHYIEGELGIPCENEEHRARLVFEWLLKAHPSPLRELETPALQLVARLCVLESPHVYVLETLGLGGLAVMGAQAGIVRGMPPLACVATGVTICFGGVLRDLLCQRQVAIGGQSYALATAAGASVYVALRELVLAGYYIPLTLRIVLGGATAIAQRMYSFYCNGTDDRFLQPMANYRNTLKTSQLEEAAIAEELCDAAARGDIFALRRLVVDRGANPSQGDYDHRTALQ
ncbi:MAG: hypothetical protein SGPRY_004780 [Prymnesium sp.]